MVLTKGVNPDGHNNWGAGDTAPISPSINLPKTVRNAMGKKEVITVKFNYQGMEYLIQVYHGLVIYDLDSNERPSREIKSDDPLYPILVDLYYRYL